MTILTPFFVAALFAYLANPLVARLMRWRFPRSLAVISVFSLMLFIIILMLAFLIPLFEEQVMILFNKLPLMLTWLQTVALPWANAHWDMNLQLDIPTIKSAITDHWQEIGNWSGSVVRTLTHSGTVLVVVILNIILIPVVTFYFLRDWPLLTQNIKDLFPRRVLPAISDFFSQSNDVVSAFFRGQLLVMLALGIIYSLGLSIIGIDLALLIGFVIALLSIVPYLGTMIGLLIAVIAALFQFHDITHLIYVVILFVVGHVLEGFVLTPWLIGDRIGLHPVAVIFAVLAGGQLFGFVGVLLALPVAAVIMVLLRKLHGQYLNSQMYQR